MSTNLSKSHFRNKARDLGILVAVTIPIVAVLSLPSIIKETYVRNTTKSIKAYNIHVDQIYAKEDINYMKVSGDTTCTLQFFPLNFEEDKEYNIQIRTYGFKFIETYRLEKPRK